MSRLTRDGTAEPVSRDQILRHARGQGNVHFPCSADHEQDWQPYPVDPYSAICDDHTYIHTYIHTVNPKRISSKNEPEYHDDIGVHPTCYHNSSVRACAVCVCVVRVRVSLISVLVTDWSLYSIIIHLTYKSLHSSSTEQTTVTIKTSMIHQ